MCVRVREFSFFVKRTSLLLGGILLFGLLLRLVLAPHPGYGFDLGTNQGWGKSVVFNGVGTAYEKQVDNTMIPNYPPLSVEVFGGAAWFYKLLSPEFTSGTTLYRIVIKLPFIFADLGMALALFFVVKKLRSERAGLLAALLFVLHPVAWFDSAVWGQSDILFSLLSFLAVVLLAKERFWIGGALVALALLTKVQAVIFLPIIGLLLLQKPWQLWKSLLGGLIATAVVTLPFALRGTLTSILDPYLSAAGFYPDLTFNAYNFWWSMFPDGAGGHKDHDVIVGFLTYRHAGLVVVSILYAVILWRLWRTLRTRKQVTLRIEAVLTASALCVFAFYLFSTEMHERYLFPLMVFGLPLAFLRRENMMPYVVASLCMFVNLLGVLPVTSIDRWFFSFFPGLDVFVASVSVFVFFLWLYRAWYAGLRPAHAFPWIDVRAFFRWRK